MPTDGTIEELANAMPYPGRFLLVGNTSSHLFSVYGVTARSAASKAKRYVLHPSAKTIVVEPTDAAVMAQGDLSLLDYTAARFFANGVVMGNGRQVEKIAALDGSVDASALLTRALLHEDYEHDAYCTPRITTCITKSHGIWTQALHAIHAATDGSSARTVYTVDDIAPRAHFLSTYAGPNVRPTPTFTAAPIALQTLTGDAKCIAQRVYDAFAPQQGEDLRVAVVTVCVARSTGERTVAIVNAADVRAL